MAIQDLLYKAIMGRDYLMEQEKLKLLKEAAMRQAQEPTLDIQKALISGGMAQPFTPQMTQQAQPAVPQFPNSMSFLQKAQSQYTRPDFTAGGIPFKYEPSVDMALKQAQLKNLGATTELYNQYLSQIGKGGKGGIKGVSISKAGPTVQFGETPEEAQAREIETAKEKNLLPTADMKNLSKQAELQLDNVRALKTLAEKLPGGWGGIASRGVGIVSRAKYQGDTYEYMTKVPAFSAGLYRALTGDNRLSDMDAQRRAEPLVWNPSIDESRRDSMFGFLENALEARKNLLAQGKFTQTKEGDVITDLESVKLEAKKIQARKAGYNEEEINNFLLGGR